MISVWFCVCGFVPGKQPNIIVAVLLLSDSEAPSLDVAELIATGTGLGAEDVSFLDTPHSTLEDLGVEKADVEFDRRISSSTPSIAFLDAHFRASGNTGVSCAERYSWSGMGKNFRRVSIQC